RRGPLRKTQKLSSRHNRASVALQSRLRVHPHKASPYARAMDEFLKIGWSARSERRRSLKLLITESKRKGGRGPIVRERGTKKKGEKV
ncbi:hypothetical protein VIGAN_01182700, partial [Vigna angularis var. angularis]